MAFKMKGSAFKLGNVATKSALQQTSPMKDTQSWGRNPRTGAWDEDWAEKDTHNKKHKSNPDWDHEKEKKDATSKVAKKAGSWMRKGEMEGGPQMKSPLEQNKEKFTKTESKAKKSDVQPKPVKKSTPDPQGPTDPGETNWTGYGGPKMKSPMKDKGNAGSWYDPDNKEHVSYAKTHDALHSKNDPTDPPHGEPKSPNKMKSPLEQTKFWDKVKSAGKGAIAALTAVDDFAQTGAAEYRRSKKKYRDADRKEKMEK